MQRPHCFCNIHTLMMAQDQAENSEQINHGRFINQFSPGIIKINAAR